MGFYLQNLKIPVVFAGLVGLCRWWCFTDFESMGRKSLFFKTHHHLVGIFWRVFFSPTRQKLANLSQIENLNFGKIVASMVSYLRGLKKSETFRVCPTMGPTCLQLGSIDDHNMTTSAWRGHCCTAPLVWPCDIGFVDGNQKSGEANQLRLVQGGPRIQL